MKTSPLTLIHRIILLGSVLASLTGVVGCQNHMESSETLSSSNTLESNTGLKLGTLQGELRLPQGQECTLFTAYQVGEESPLFEIDIEQSQVRNHRYSFLHILPEGDYQVKGTLACDSEEEGRVEYHSLHDDVSIFEGDTSGVQFRFFFDVESDLNQVDLKFCADLALRSLSPAFEACPDEQIQGEYDVDWLHEECGAVFLQLDVDSNIYNGDEFAFPSTTASLEGYAPHETGMYTLTIALSSPEGGSIELYQSDLEVVNCGDDE